MTFIVQVQVEAENVKDALDKVATGDVISVNPRPGQPQQQGQVITGGTSFQRTQTVATPKLNG